MPKHPLNGSARGSSRRLGVIAAALFCAVAGVSLRAGGQESAAGPDSPEQRIAALEAELDRVRGALPAQAAAMTVVEYNYSNLWFAAHERNWPLARFFLSETRARLRWALRITPERRISSGTVVLQPFLDAFERMPYAAIEQALEREDVGAFEAAYTQGLGACEGCHSASEKAFLQLHVPSAPAGPLIDFAGH